MSSTLSNTFSSLLLRATFGQVDELLESPLTLRLATAVGESEFTEVPEGGYAPVPLVLGGNIELTVGAVTQVVNTEPITFEWLPECVVTHTVLTGTGKQIITAVPPVSVGDGGRIVIPAGALTVRLNEE